MKNTIVITGGTGLIGKRLSELLPSDKYDLRILTRSKRAAHDNVSYFTWDPLNGEINISVFEGCDYVITLAGAGIADKRWTDKRKRLIIDSRVKGNEIVRTSLAKIEHRPKAIIAASAIGFYGDRKDEILTESSEAGSTEFLTESTLAWENSIHRFNEISDRLSIIRIGIVLSTKGGALEKMLLPLNFGISGYFGDGSQYYSWIHIDDICQMFIDLIEQKLIAGIYNGVAPDPVSNKKLTNTITKVTRSLGFSLPVPSMALKFIFGEMSNTILNSTNVSAQKIQKEGFEFKFPEIRDAIQDLITRKI